MNLEHKNRKQRIDRLVEAMGRFFVMMQEVNNTCLFYSEDISKKELLIISFVGNNKRVIMREITDYMKIPVSTTTGLVDKLVHKGYLARQFSETDRRSIYIVLDKLGEQTHALLSDMKIEMAGKILDDLEEYEADSFIGMLEKITDNLYKYLPQG